MTYNRSFVYVLAYSLRLKCLLCHRQSPFKGLVTADKSTGMHKDTTWNAGDFRQLAVPHTPPRFGEGFAVDKGIGRFGDTLDAPFGRSFGFGVKDVEDRGGSLWKGGLEGEKMVFPWARLVKCLALVSVKRQETRDLVKYNDSTAGMHFRPLFQSFFHDIPSWQPSESKVVQL